jgi:tryptophan synthase alpha subunit
MGTRGGLSLVVKRPGREADHSPPSSAEVKEWVELYIHSPTTPSWRGAQLKHRDNFTFYLTVYGVTTQKISNRTIHKPVRHLLWFGLGDTRDVISYKCKGFRKR